MPQKRNKIIVLIGTIIILLIIGISILRYISNDSFLIQKCDNLLKDTINNGLIFSHNQAVCKVVTSKLFRTVKEIQPNDIVKPGDQVIISINMANILAGKLSNIFTGENIKKPENNISTLCFVIYPNLQSESKYLKSEIVKNFYQDYYWRITPDNIMDFTSKGDNYICTQPLDLKQYSKISLFYTIPSQDFLKLGAANARNYGLVIAFIPKINSDLLDVLNDISLNAVSVNTNDVLPIYFYLKPITFE